MLAFWIIVLAVAAVLIGGWAAATATATPQHAPPTLLAPGVGAVWILYGFYETFVVRPEDNVRVDLVLLYPLLLAGTMIGVVSLIQWFRRKTKLSQLPPPSASERGQT